MNELLQAMEKYFYEQVDAGLDPDEAYEEIQSLVNDDLQLTVEAYKATKKHDD